MNESSEERAFGWTRRINFFPHLFSCGSADFNGKIIDYFLSASYEIQMIPFRMLLLKFLFLFMPLQKHYYSRDRCRMYQKELSCQQ